jgi:hypothetical protein
MADQPSRSVRDLLNFLHCLYLTAWCRAFLVKLSHWAGHEIICFYGTRRLITAELHYSMQLRTPAEAKIISSSLCVQISCEAHPASYPTGNGDLSPGIKCGRRVTLTTHPHLEPRSTMSYTPLPFGVCVAVEGQLYYFFFLLLHYVFVSCTHERKTGRMEELDERRAGPGGRAD